MSCARCVRNGRVCERVGVRVFSLDGEHESCVRKVNEYVAALASGGQLSSEARAEIRAVPGLEPGIPCKLETR